MVSPAGDAGENQRGCRGLDALASYIVVITKIGICWQQADRACQLQKVLPGHDSRGGGGHVFDGFPDCIDILHGEVCRAIVRLEDHAACRVLGDCGSKTS